MLRNYVSRFIPCRHFSALPNHRSATERKERERIAATLDLLEKWDLKEVHPLIFSSMLKACGDAKAIDEGRRLHARIKSMYPRHTLLDNQIMEMYGKCGNVELARHVFDSIAYPNVHSYNILLAAYALKGHLHSAAELFEWMPEKDDVSWNTMLGAFVKRGFLEDAKDVFQEMPRRNVIAWNSLVTAFAAKGQIERAWLMFLETPHKNVASWNAIIAGFFHCGNTLKALQLYRMMLKEGIRPSRMTFLEMLQACVDYELLVVGRELHKQVSESDFHSDVSVVNVVLAVYAKYGSLDECLSTFNGMQAKDATSWTWMIAAFARSGHLQTAEKIFREMTFRTERTWTTMLTAYAEGGHMEKASFLFEELLEKSRVDYVIMISAYGRANDLVGAARIFEEALYLRDARCWSCMILAYARNGRPSEALKLLRKMDIEGLHASEEALEACSAFM